MKKKILCIGAHADDIELSFGGTLARYRKEYGYEIGYIMATDNASGGISSYDAEGRISEYTPPTSQIRPIRHAEANAAAREMYGTEAVHLNYPQSGYMNENGERVRLRYGVPGAYPGAQDVPTILSAYRDKEAVERLRDLILAFDPEVILTMNLSDMNPEHVCTALLALAAYRAAQLQGQDATILHSLPPAVFPVGAYFNGADTFVDTSGYFEEKMRAVGYHRSQKPEPWRLDMRDFDEGARFGCKTAERFVVGEMAKVRTGPLTVEIRKNQNICLDMPLRKLISR